MTIQEQLIEVTQVWHRKVFPFTLPPAHTHTHTHRMSFAIFARLVQQGENCISTRCTQYFTPKFMQRGERLHAKREISSHVHVSFDVCGFFRICNFQSNSRAVLGRLKNFPLVRTSPLRSGNITITLIEEAEVLCKNSCDYLGTRS